MTCALSENTRVAIVGGGKMGEAMMGGWIAATEGPAAALTADSFVVANPGEERRVYLSDTYGVRCVADAAQIEAADIVVLSVKPQKLTEVLAVLSACPYIASARVISVAAGWACERIESLLPANVHVCRVMPNTPLLVGRGASVVCGGAHATADEVALTEQLFACLGRAWVIPEDKMDAAGAISGSGPAYVAAFIEALTAAGVSNGFDAREAEEMALATVAGTCELMMRRNQTAERTRIDVCSPGGTTLAALEAMDEAGFSESVCAGVDAAIARSVELGRA